MAACALTAGLESQPPVRHASLIMESGMTLQAKLSSFTPHQQHAVGAAVRRVAGSAALHLRCRMFVDIRAAFFRVAIHTGFSIQLVQAGMIQRSVRIVTIAALNQALRDAVMHGQGKLSLHIAMTAKAQCGLRLLQKTAVQPAHLVRKLWHLEEMTLRIAQVTLALVLDLSDQVRSVALIA
jgi:hypothetical protein